MMAIGVTLRQLETFVAVAEQGGYTKAAELLRVSQPALTERIRRLEQVLGFLVFDRSTRSVMLTGAGRAFLVATKSVLGDLSSALDDANAIGRRQRTQIVVACVPSVAARLVGPSMQCFIASNSGVQIKILDGDAVRIGQNVRTGEADFGISGSCFVDCDQELDFRPLLRDRYCVVCAADHPLATTRVVRLKELENYSFIALEGTASTRHILDLAVAKANVKLNIVCEIAQPGTLYSIVRAGLGLSVMSEAGLPMGKHSGIIARRLVEPVLERELGLVTVRGRNLKSSARSFRDALLTDLPRVWSKFTSELYLSN